MVSDNLPTPAAVLELVERDLCTGCGVCAAVCPAKSLTMRLNERGQFVPALDGSCGACGRCWTVCPQLAEMNANGDGKVVLSHEPSVILGCSKASTMWGGYALNPSRRLMSASGGIVTLLLEHLLRLGRVDGAVVVRLREPGEGHLFRAILARTVEELRTCAGSKYYPVELSQPLREIMKTGMRAAIVGLPCHIRAIRRLLRQAGPLNRPAPLLFGLTCGHGVSALFTGVLAAAAGVHLGSVDTVSYRGKNGKGNATDCVFSTSREGQVVGRSLSFLNGIYGVAWRKRLFVPRACDFCPDCFAEEADATFMDAWLPEYMWDPRGTSLIVSRSLEITQGIERLSKDGFANLWTVRAADIVKSQMGVVRFKRELLPARVYTALQQGQNVPPSICGLAARGSPQQERENSGYDRWRRTANTVWRLRLPPWARVRILLLLLGPGIPRGFTLVLRRIAGKRNMGKLKALLSGRRSQ